jgi:hypothetical protein
MATWFIDVMPLTGEFVTRKADDSLPFEEIQNQLVESLYEFPLLFSFRLRNGTVIDTGDREEFLKKPRWPVLCLPPKKEPKQLPTG